MAGWILDPKLSGSNQGQCGLTVEGVAAGRQVQAGLGVLNPGVHLHRHAAHLVDQRGQPGRVDLHEVGDGDAEVLLDRPDER